MNPKFCYVVRLAAVPGVIEETLVARCWSGLDLDDVVRGMLRDATRADMIRISVEVAAQAGTAVTQ